MTGSPNSNCRSPCFLRWNGRTVAAAALLFLTVAGVHGQEGALDPAETCEGKAEGAECWKQLSSHPGCYVWDNGLKADQTVSWTGACNGSVADGEGVLTWADREDATVLEGALVGGKLHGRVSVTQGNGTVAEGNFAAGQQVGRWRYVWADGTVVEGIMASGRLTGRWVWRYADDPADDPADHGRVREALYVNGKKHGTEILRYANGTVRETPYVSGEIHGTEVYRYAGGGVMETPYVNGEIHGTAIIRDADGYGSETPYVNGETHGTRIVRSSTDTVETPFVNGERHGTEVQRWAWGDVMETPWVNGERHGTQVKRSADGTVHETRWVNGKRQPASGRRESSTNPASAGRSNTPPSQAAGQPTLLDHMRRSGRRAPAAATKGAQCLIPGFPSPDDPENLGFSWCPASVDFQVRVFAISAAGAQCAIATGTSSTPDQIAARQKETADLCTRLDAVSERFGTGGGPDCRCPADWR